MLFCKTTTEDVQRSVSFSEENVNSMGMFKHSISDSVKEDNAENLSKAEEVRNPLKRLTSLFYVNKIQLV